MPGDSIRFLSVIGDDEIVNLVQAALARDGISNDFIVAEMY